MGTIHGSCRISEGGCNGSTGPNEPFLRDEGLARTFINAMCTAWGDHAADDAA